MWLSALVFKLIFVTGSKFFGPISFIIIIIIGLLSIRENRAIEVFFSTWVEFFLHGFCFGFGWIVCSLNAWTLETLWHLGSVTGHSSIFVSSKHFYCCVFFSNMLIYCVFVCGSLEMGLVQHLMICFGVLFEFVKEMGLKGILTYILFT